MFREFLLTWLWLWLRISEGQDPQDVDMVCVFPDHNDPQEIVKYLTHDPHIKLNIFYWHLSQLGFNAASLSLPSHFALQLTQEFGAECEPVRKMTVASREYVRDIRSKYQSRRKTLERTLQCTITYDTYDQLLQQRVDSKMHSPNIIVSIRTPHAHLTRSQSVYVLDTGIQSNHSQFQQLPPQHGFDALSSPPLRSDPHGHGTQVAGRITIGVDLNFHRADCREIIWSLSSITAC